MVSRASVLKNLRAFRGAEDGIAATEFAFALPIMITLYFGVVTVADGFAMKQRVETLSRTAADLVGRLPATATGGNPTINDTEISNVAQAAASTLAPYDPSGLVITLAHVVVRLNGTNPQGVVCWSAARRVESRSSLVATAVPAAWAKGAVVQVPAGLRRPGLSYVLSEVRHTYTPVVGNALIGEVGLQSQAPWPVRSGQQIVWQGQAACPIS